ncbi:hypothetical protein [Taibaiella koreensis]|uniref:hypothetical protein n=1 Tax=Taibaiella koreensis TaxID=1268548 RepID=UPI000E59F38B|nr:hypothetical protein [Taibaiella koreensis]
MVTKIILAVLVGGLLTACNSPENKKTAESNRTELAVNQDTPRDVTHEQQGTVNEAHVDISPALTQFIPEGYTVINQSTGDANRDGIADKILVLKRDNEAATSDYVENKPVKRPLLLLLGKADSSYRLALRHDNAVYCIDCGGRAGDPFTGTTIKNGYFSIEHGVAGGEHWEQVTTFKYDKATQNWFLYKDHFISYKFNESSDPNAEALVPDVDKTKTVKDFGKVPFNKFDLYKEVSR